MGKRITGKQVIGAVASLNVARVTDGDRWGETLDQGCSIRFLLGVMCIIPQWRGG